MSGERRKNLGQITLFYSAVLVLFFLDQVSKAGVGSFSAAGKSTPVIKNIFHITLVHNTGAAFGMLRGLPDLFIVISILASAVISYLIIVKRERLSAADRVALCLILGGTLGNLSDRLRMGYVVDFLDFRVWPVFNLADSFITLGAAVLAWKFISGHRRNKAESRGLGGAGRSGDQRRGE